MNLKEFDEFSLSDAIHFHDELNHAIFAGDKMKEDVRLQLLNIAEDFIDHLGIQGLDISDITVSGSSAAFSYTKHSDIDLHILVDFNQFKDDDVYRELFDAKKTVYNDTHDITIGGFPVELYVQDTNQPVISLGEYSVVDDKWIKLPRKRKANFDQYATKLKYDKLYRLSEFAYKSNSSKKIETVLKTIKRYRKAGLDFRGEFGPENLAYKALRSKGIIAKLYEKLQDLHNQRLSLPEGMFDRFFKPKMQFNFEIQGDELYCDVNLGKENVANFTFDMIGHDLEAQDMHVVAKFRGQGIAKRVYDMLKARGYRIHRSENQTLDGKHFWNKNRGPDVKVWEETVTECSGYIPSEAQKDDPRWERALSVDVHPNTMKEQAKKFGWKIKRNGVPPTLRP